MNKVKKVLLSMMGGIDVVMYMFTPMILVTIWISVIGLNSFGSYFLFFLGLIAMIFRAIKVGWMK